MKKIDIMNMPMTPVSPTAMGGGGLYSARNIIRKTADSAQGKKHKYDSLAKAIAEETSNSNLMMGSNDQE